LTSFRLAIDAIRNGSIVIDHLLGDEYSLEDIGQAMERARRADDGSTKLTIVLGN
jgi:Zn-dependent alcohol dehydrogenase